MTVSEAAAKLNLRPIAGSKGLETEINGVYLGDLLSWVMGRAKERNIWITIQGHVNVAAVALLTGVSCVIVAEGAEIGGELAAKADAEGIPLFASDMDVFTLVKLIVGLGIA
ncbi:MAG: AraC family transcriptional regulator [Clostridiales bacterium]|jgi:predicted transcriptional regulator|nr:AraC family transcriptional regulator [Clostridiales bacterium]